MEWAWLAPALSFVAFGLIVVLGRYLPGKGSFLAILAIAAGVGVFWYVLSTFLNKGVDTYEFSIKWLELGDSRIDWGLLIDPLSLVMLGIVSFIALLIQVYSIGYMSGDKRIGWYFAAHALFVAAMLTLVLANNFLLLYIAWELVGLGSYLLIGFWYERRTAAEAAKKAFVTTRIGDVGLLIGILILFKATGTFQMTSIFEAAGAGEIANGTLTTAVILIFFGAMGKSAQFPLHVWLPDAMEGPTPVSALIHAATMVVAGVYLVARAFPLFEMAPPAMLLVSIVGLITAGIGASMALVMTDIKRILAYSTVSHLGLMMLALGAGGLVAGIFHLLAHASSKALLFLGAGSVMHAMNDETDIRKMGGLRRAMPITSVTFLIGALSLAGIAPLAGFWSKDELLLAVLDGGNSVFFAITLVIVFFSALYMARIYFVVFTGEANRDTERAHESPWVMVLPLAILATGAALVGFIALNVGEYEGFASFLTFGDHHFELNIFITSVSVLLAFGGFGLGYAIYARKAISTENLVQRFNPLHRLLVNKYYLDNVYQWGIDRVVLVFSTFVAAFDRIVVNDGAVNGIANTIRNSGFRIRYLETGMLYNYALGMVLGVMAVGLFWWLVIPRIV
jgi:NADH-quinone oxidoreductase subunit L